MFIMRLKGPFGVYDRIVTR